MNVISRTANGTSWKYRFNKDFTLWRPLAPRLIVSPTANGVSPTANKSLAPGLHTIRYNKNTIQKTVSAVAQGAPAPAQPFDGNPRLLMKDKQEHIRIIGYYAVARKIPPFQTPASLSAFITRHCQEAKLLAGNEKRVKEVLLFCEKNASQFDFAWGLSTVVKWIDKDLNQIINSYAKRRRD